MNVAAKLLGESAPPVDIERFDFSTLVGHKVTVYAEQFPGKPLASRVTVATGKAITIDRSGGAGLIDNLVNNQRVVLQIQYKGQPVSVAATVQRTDGGTCRIHLGEKVTPLFRRRFQRVPVACPIRLAALPMTRFNPSALGQLRWLETESVNLSGGGTMISFSSLIESPTYLFVNVDRSEFGFPGLVLGQVRHALAVEAGRWHIGIQFIAREERPDHVRFPSIRQVPSALFALDHATQTAIEQSLIAWMQEHNS